MEVNGSQGFRTPIYIEEKHELRGLMDFKRSSQIKRSYSDRTFGERPCVSFTVMHASRNASSHACISVNIKQFAKLLKLGVSQ